MDRATIDELSLLLSQVSGLLIFNYLGNSFFPQARFFFLLISCFAVAAAVRNTRMFKQLALSARRRLNPAGEPTADRKDLLMSLYDISQYLAKSKKTLARKRTKFRKLSGRQQAIVQQAGYIDKLNELAKRHEQNYSVLQRVYDGAKEKYCVSVDEISLASDYADATGYSDHFRVVEALCHFARDWSPQMYDREVKPLVDYITSQTSTLPKESTAVIVPGSGLGRVSHEIAKLGFKHVDSVEYSWLMSLFNESIYGDTKQSAEIYPYVQNFSSHNTTADQLRPETFTYGQTIPENLTIQSKDFLNFTPDKNADNLLIVTCFFIDTAENMLDYMDNINRIALQYPGKKRWINVGPLKYGTNPLVEFSNEEVAKVRESMGWHTVDEQPPKTLGYMTDTVGLWKGYYGVCMWTADR